MLGQQNKKNLHLECTVGYLSQQLVATACQMKEGRTYLKNALCVVSTLAKADDDIPGH